MIKITIFTISFVFLSACTLLPEYYDIRLSIDDVSLVFGESFSRSVENNYVHLPNAYPAKARFINIFRIEIYEPDLEVVKREKIVLHEAVHHWQALRGELFIWNKQQPFNYSLPEPKMFMNGKLGVEQEAMLVVGYVSRIEDGLEDWGREHYENYMRVFMGITR